MERSAIQKILTSGKVSRLGLLVAVVAALSAVGPAGAAASFTVNSTGDGRDANFADGRCDAAAESGDQCTLRAAIEQANETPGADEIRFEIGGDGVRTIRPATGLPVITEAITIAGYSQPGTRKNTLARGTNALPLIEIDGRNAGTVRGLEISASGVTVRGLVVGGFGFGGIFTEGANTRIEGNFIGTNPNGTSGNGNDFSGVSVGGVDAVVGGPAPEARNLVSGNLSDGIALLGSGARVRGNLVGTAKDGISALPNANDGVQVINGSSNTVGGTSPAEANTVAFNGGSGVEIAGFESSANRILRNSLFKNGALGIDLVGGIESLSGATQNDPRDQDSGPNGLQNRPALSSARTANGKTTVRGNLASTPKRTFTLRLFSDEPGAEGKTFLSKKAVTTNAEGNATFGFSLGAAVPAGRFLTATATGVEGTSEFSEPRQITKL